MTDAVTWLGDIQRDIRFAIRALGRTPTFTLIAILTIAVGIAATTTIAAMADGLLLQPLPVPDAERVISVDEDRSGSVHTGPEGVRVPYPRFERYRAATPRVFTGLAAHQYTRTSVSYRGEAVVEAGANVTRNFFDVLGLKPAAGQFFDAGRDPVVVISDDLWAARFNRDRAALGAQVLVDGKPYTIIGITPRGFGGSTVPFVQNVWVPIDSRENALTESNVGFFGRLQPGVSLKQAREQVVAAATSITPDEEHTTVSGARVDVLTGIGSNLRPDAQLFVLMLLAMAVLVLLIAAANLGGMQLTRAAARRREIAVRLAIGAGRKRLVRQLLTESMVLFVIGGAVGIALAMWITLLLGRISMPIAVPIKLNLGVDGGVMLLALAVSAVTGLVFGLAPAFGASNPDLVTSLKESTPSTPRRGHNARAWFVGGQITIAVVLLVVAGLFVRSLQKATDAQLGFNPGGVVVGSLDLAAHDYDEAQQQQFFSELSRRLRAIPEVRSVGMSHLALLSGSNMSNDVRGDVDGVPEVDGAGANIVDTAFFRTLDMRITAGRAFTSADAASAPRSAIVNETLASKLWTDMSPIGRRLSVGDDSYVVVGVAVAARYNGVTEDPRPYYFLPLEQHPRSPVAVHVRSTLPAGEMLGRLARAANAIEPAVAIDQGRGMDELAAATIFPQRFAAALVGVFGVIGLLLAALGVYGVLSFQVAQRTREFGIRMALGSTEHEVLGGVLRNGARLAIIGGVVGLVLAAAATRVLRSFLFGIAPLDPVTFIAVPVLLCLVALLASYIPARRATRVPPTVALRSQ